eukprot:23110_1
MGVTAAKCGCSTDRTQADGDVVNCDDYYKAKYREAVCLWLQNLGLTQYYNNFIENGLDQMDIILMEPNLSSKLNQIGVQTIDQRIIIQSIENHCAQSTKTKIISTCIDAPLMDNNTVNIFTENKSGLLQFTDETNINDHDLHSTWKCNECLNVNSKEISVCLKCGEKRNKDAHAVHHGVDKKWAKQAVNV